MTYTGRVFPGGPADVRELPQLIVSKLSDGPMDNNTYLLRDRITGTQVLIDAANDADQILEFVGSGGLAAVITTHSHPDHTQALATVAAATGAQTIAGEPDVAGIGYRTDRAVNDGDIIEFGQTHLEVIALRGHTPGAIALFYDDPMGREHLFTGDSLFPGGLGKTWSPADFDQLFADVSERLFDRFGDETWIYPGHGNDTTLGDERPHLAEWRQRGW